MADRTIVIAPVGGDYSNLAAAIAGEVAANADLTTDNGSGGAGALIFQMQGDWTGTEDTAAVVVNGFTASLTCYVGIQTDASNRATAAGWQNSRYRLSVSNAIALVLADQFVWVDGLQIEVPAMNAIYQYICHPTTCPADSYHRISNCRLRGASSTDYHQYGLLIDSSGLTIDVWNLIVENLGGSGTAVGRGIYSLNATVANIYNSLVYNCYSSGFRRTNGTVTIKNCVSFKNDDDFLGTITADYCASDDDDGTNNVVESGGGADWAADFVDAANGDFRLLPTSNLVNAGQSNPGAGLFSNDMEGTTRRTWDIGSYEYPIPPTVLAGAQGFQPQPPTWLFHRYCKGQR